MVARKRKLGRPPRSGKTADVRFEIRLTGAESKAWQSAADKEGISLADLVRASVDLAIARGSTR